MMYDQKGFMKFTLVVIIIIASLFVIHDKDGQSYGKKIIAKVEDFVAGVKKDTLNTRDVMQAHENELQKNIDALQ